MPSLDPNDRRDAHCLFCGDKPGGCAACVGQEAQVASFAARLAGQRAQMDEALLCLREVLNTKPGRPGQPPLEPTDEAIILVVRAFEWKQRQEAKRVACAPAQVETQTEATGRRFGAIEWSGSPACAAGERAKTKDKRSGGRRIEF
jgi:hypothetical protein